MTIELDHLIVPVLDKQEAVRFYERIFGFVYAGPMGPFAPIRIPGQGLTLDFDTWESVEPLHFAFRVSEIEFDRIFARIREAELVYGSGPHSAQDMEINHWNGGRGVYFRDPSGHLLELLTRPAA